MSPPSLFTEVVEGYLGSVGSPIVWKVFSITGPTSYPTGGVDLTASDMKLSKVFLVLSQVGSTFTSGSIRQVYDYTNQKLLWTYQNHTHQENTAGAYAQNANTATVNTASMLATEITAGTNLSSDSFRILVIGLRA